MIISRQFQNELFAMNATDKNSIAPETLTLLAVATCVISAAWFFVTNVIA